jgi:peptide/nickel transport system ATP-binding protein
MALVTAPNDGKVLLEVRHLTVTYRSGRNTYNTAVSDVTFRVLPGEVVGIIGASGSGKTSLGYTVLRLLPASAVVEQGAVILQGRDLLRASESELRRIRGAQIGFIFQEPVTALNPVIRVGEQISEVIRAHTQLRRKQCREAAVSVLRAVRLLDVDGIYSAYPHELSGGQRQRIVIAQALACQPALVIADEPTTAIDTTTQAEILDLLKDLKQRVGMAMLFITHDPSTLAGLADRLIVMHSGKIVEEGDFTEVCNRSLHPYTRLLLQAVPLARKRSPPKMG